MTMMVTVMESETRVHIRLRTNITLFTTTALQHNKLAHALRECDRVRRITNCKHVNQNNQIEVDTEGRQ